MGGYFAIPICSMLMAYLITIFGINPGEKILKYSYSLGRTLRNDIGRLKSYLKGMQELKQKRIEVNKNER
jgi:archaellum component FlaD/FlaE